MDEKLEARWQEREELIRQVENGRAQIRLRHVQDFDFLVRFLFSQISVKVNDRSPFLDLILRLSVFYNENPWVTGKKGVLDDPDDYLITINFEPIIWMLLRINEPEMRDMLVIATNLKKEDKLRYVGDFYTLPPPTGVDDSRLYKQQLLARLLDMTELSDFDAERIERLVSQRWNMFCAVCDLPLRAVSVKGSVSKFDDRIDSNCTIVARRWTPSDTREKHLPVRSSDDSDDRNPKFVIYAPVIDRYLGLNIDKEMLTMDFGAIGGFVDSTKGRKDNSNPILLKLPPRASQSAKAGAYFYQLFWKETSENVKFYRTGIDQASQTRILEPYFSELERHADDDMKSLQECELICAAQALYPVGIKDNTAREKFLELILWMYHSCAMQGSLRMEQMMQTVRGCIEYRSNWKMYDKCVEPLTVVLMLLTLHHDDDKTLPKILWDFLTWSNGKEDWQKELGLSKSEHSRNHWINHWFRDSERLRAPCRSITSLVREFLGLLDPEAWSSIEVKFGDEIREIERQIQDGLGIIRQSD